MGRYWTKFNRPYVLQNAQERDIYARDIWKHSDGTMAAGSHVVHRSRINLFSN